MQPPPGYKAGIGRGATGFTTRADVPLQRAEVSNVPNHPDRFIDADDTGLLGPNTKLAQEEREAERVYGDLNDRLSRRHGKSRRASTPEPETPDDAENFKQNLATISIDEWANLPEATDLTRRNKRQRLEEDMEKRSYAVPDSLFASNRGFDSSIEVDVEAMEAKDNALSARLDFALKTRLGAEETSASPTPALPSLSDTERKQALLETMIKTQPNQPQGYIGLARLHAQAQQFKKARATIHRAMERCPSVAEVWLEALNLHHGTDQQAIMSKAVEAAPKSPDVWRAVIELQPTLESKLQFVHRALEELPENSALWELAVDLESPEDREDVLSAALDFAPSANLYLKAAARNPQRLDEAVKMFPSDKRLWLELIRQGVSAKKALEATGTDGWIEIARNCSQEGDLPTMEKIISELQLTEEDFDKLCDSQDHAAAKFVAQKLPKTPTLYLKWAQFEPEILEKAAKEFNDSEDLLISFVKHDPDRATQVFDSENVLLFAGKVFLDNGDLERACAVLARTEKADGRSAYVQALVQIGKVDKAKEVVEAASKAFPDYGQLYIQQAALFKDPGALQKASVRLPKNERIWVALSKMLPDVRARAILISAQMHCPKNAKLWLTRIQLERKAGRDAEYLLTKALQECPKDGYLWAEKLLQTPKIQRTKAIPEAVKSANSHPAVLVAAGLHQWALNKRDITKWFEAAIKQNPQYGDAFLWLAFFHGIDSTRGREISTQVQEVKPTEGELWEPIYANQWGQPIQNTFRAAVEKLENPFL